jgi:hypothetical protein
MRFSNFSLKNVKNHLIKIYDVKLFLWGVNHKFNFTSNYFSGMAPYVARLLKMEMLKIPLHIS